MITVILKHDSNRTYAIGTLRLKTTQLFNNEVIEFPAFLELRAGHGENIITHPTYEDHDEVRQIDNRRFCLTGTQSIYYGYYRANAALRLKNKQIFSACIMILNVVL